MQLTQVNMQLTQVHLKMADKIRDLRSFEIRFDFKSDVPIQFESDGPIRNFRIAAFTVVQEKKITSSLCRIGNQLTRATRESK